MPDFTVVSSVEAGLVLQWEALGAVVLFPRISDEADPHFRV